MHSLRRALAHSPWCWLLLAWCCVLPRPAPAYGALGHRLIAQQAGQGLTPSVRAEIAELLGGVSLADAASWADDIRSQPAWRHTAPWHYVNFPRGDCHYDAAALCPGGQCLVHVLQVQTAILADRTQAPARRAEALKFVVHFYGDLHQPLHLGLAADKGGNDFQIRFPQQNARAQAGDDPDQQALKRWWSNQIHGYNLHRLWDSLLLESLSRDEAGHLQALHGLMPEPGLLAEREPVALAEAGCRIAQQPGFYPAGHRIDPSYVRRHQPLLLMQLRLAGLRLAAWLNQALAPR